MPEHVYPWKRFWYPRETSIELLDGGYLYRPETEWANQFFDGNLVTLSELAAIQCLILLGEPGLGKSRELGQQHTFTHDHFDEAVLWCDFSAYQEQSMLARALFVERLAGRLHHPEAAEGMNGHHPDTPAANHPARAGHRLGNVAQLGILEYPLRSRLSKFAEDPRTR